MLTITLPLSLLLVSLPSWGLGLGLGFDEDDDDDDDDEDEDDSDDDDSDSDEDIRDLDILTNEKLYAMLNTFFVDEYGVTIATSMSNISYELHNLNKNLGKLLKSKN